MNLQLIIDTIAEEVKAIQDRAEADRNYCRGAIDALKRIVELANAEPAKETNGTEEPNK